MAKQQTFSEFSIENILGSDYSSEKEIEKNIEEVPTETLDFSIESILGPDALTPKVSEPPSVPVPVETAVEQPVVAPTVSPRKPLAQQIEASREVLRRADDAKEKAMREGASLTEAEDIRKKVLEEGGVDTPDFAKAEAAIDPVAAFEMETDFPTLDEREQEKGRAFLGKLITEPVVGVVNLAKILAELTNESIDTLIPGVKETLNTVGDEGGNVLDNVLKDLSKKYPVSYNNLKDTYEKYRGRGELDYIPIGEDSKDILPC